MIRTIVAPSMALIDLFASSAVVKGPAEIITLYHAAQQTSLKIYILICPTYIHNAVLNIYFAHPDQRFSLTNFVIAPTTSCVF